VISEEPLDPAKRESRSLHTQAELTTSSAFAERKDAGAITESLNNHIQLPTQSANLPLESRFKLKGNSEMAKFAYKTMGMKLSEASEILDDRIEEYVTLIQQYYKLDEMEFGNPATRSQDEIVAVGRIASDSHEGRLNPMSLLLETSRRLGAGLRTVLKVDKLGSYHFFPGQIVALRGSNASGSYFSAREVLQPPPQPIVTSRISDIDMVNDRIESSDGTTRPLVTLVAAGPYTTELDLDFSALLTLLRAAEELQADGLILCGPFIDTEHPLIRTGEFELPSNYPVDPDRATANDLFKAYISNPLTKLTQALPSISVILCPSVRDVVSKHAAWPQDRLNRKELGLPRQVQIVTNPMLVSLNELLFGLSSQDVLDQLRSSEVTAGTVRQTHILERGCRQIIEQRHFFPVFPPMEPKLSEDENNPYTYVSPGASLDVSYLKLGEFLGAKPDVLVTPSVLPSFVKVCYLPLIVITTLTRTSGY
jgi:DNA polymerase alpha subunit B